MKKILFILPLSALFTYCGSSRQATAPAAPSVSNVQVNGTGSTAASNTNLETRDWGYVAARDTAMNGTWQLEGMTAADGSWKSAQTWVPVDTTAMTVDTTAASTNAQPATGKSPQTASTQKSFGAKLYDTSTHFFDTTAFQQTLASRVRPFNYWQRLPELRIMPSLGIFTGNTGCNSMSGSFNFNGSDIKVDKRIRTSKMACNDYDESLFIGALLKADNYSLNNGLLELKQGTTTLLSFKRTA